MTAAPPVPPVPHGLVDIPPIPAKSHRRAVSVEAPPSRVLSPSGVKPGRPQSVDRGGLQQRTTPRAPSLQKINELERTDSQTSINFSYPSRTKSPPPRSPVTPTSAPSNVLRNGISPAEAENVQYSVARAAEQPVKKKKRKEKAAPGLAEGSHLQAGSMAASASATEHEQLQQQDPAPKKKKKKNVALTGQATHFAASSPSETSESESDSTPDKTRRTARASGLLQKQPSVVREDWEGEQDGNISNAKTPRTGERSFNSVTAPGTTVQSKKSTVSANVSRKIEDSAPSQQPTNLYSAVTMPTKSQPTQAGGNLTVSGAGARNTSLSPSRSVRISDRLASDLAAGRKHEPLARSASPAKSALKHHSSSPQGQSPIDPKFPGLRESSMAPSDVSDASTDGPPRRKKSVRVSFEAQPEVVGAAAQPTRSDNPIYASPQTRETTKRGFSGTGKNKGTLSPIQAEDDADQGMEPRPQLPSFGSVRDKNRGVDHGTYSQLSKLETQSTATQPYSIYQTTTASSTSSATSSSSLNRTLDTSISSDHAIGGLFAQDAQRKATENVARAPDPGLSIPPQVTSAERTGDVSNAGGGTAPAETITRTDSEDISTHVQPHATASASSALPTLSLQPPTPGLEQHNPSDKWQVAVPGGFPGSSLYSSLAYAPEDVTATPSETTTAATNSAGLGIAEPRPLETVATSSSVQPSALATMIQDDQVERDSDNDSIYSDAAEDLSDLEGDGFGSINAIVESPVVAPIHRIVTPPDSPLASVNSQVTSRPKESSRTASWDQAQAHWSGLAQHYRQGIQQQATPDGAERSSPIQAQMRAPEPIQTAQPVMKKKKKRASAGPVAGVLPESLGFTSDPPARPRSQPSGPPVTTSRRAEAPPAGQSSFKQSMRSAPVHEEVPTMRKSMRTTAEAAPQQTIPPAQPRGALQKKHAPPAAVAARTSAIRPPQPVQPKPVQPTLSNDSDSESSFRKERKRKASGGGGFSRSSMRAAPAAEPAREAQPSSRGGVRSVSPVARRPFSPAGGQTTMRSSMRSSMDSNAPTLRGQPQQKRSSSLFGRGSRAKSPTGAVPALPMSSKTKSRFGGSDGEDRPRQKGYNSRFVDSSDDEPEPTTFTPVRGIPRRTEEESTDLDDSSEDEKRQKPRPPKISIPAPGVAAIGEAPLSPTSEKKRGLFGRFGRKKNKDENADEAGKAAETNGTTSKKEKPSQLGFNSIEERDALIEKTRVQLEAAKERPTSPTTAGRLQRRATPQRVMSDSWPLPPKMSAITDDRPNTAEGVPESDSRPMLGSRQVTSETVKTSGGKPIAYGRSGKKKRFPMLRRAFGLND